jgi:hypothetical protein
VAIKMLHSESSQGKSQFQQEVITYFSWTLSFAILNIGSLWSIDNIIRLKYLGYVHQKHV